MTTKRFLSNCSVSHGRAVVTRIGCAQPVAGRGINGDGVDESYVSDAMSGVAAGVQRALQAVGKSLLQQNAIGQPLVVEARRVNGSLGLHAETHPIQDTEERGRNNGGATRRAGYETEFAVAEENCRRHGTEWPVTGSDGVGLGLNQAEKSVRHPGLCREVVHLIVQQESRGAGGMRAVAVVERVGAGDSI